MAPRPIIAREPAYLAGTLRGRRAVLTKLTAPRPPALSMTCKALILEPLGCRPQYASSTVRTRRRRPGVERARGGPVPIFFGDIMMAMRGGTR